MPLHIPIEKILQHEKGLTATFHRIFLRWKALIHTAPKAESQDDPDQHGTTYICSSHQLQIY